MKRPNFNCIKYDTLIELNDLKTYLKDLNKYCDFIETENKQLKLCGVMQQSGQLKDKEAPTFEEWYITNGYVRVGDTDVYILDGFPFHVTHVKQVYNADIKANL